LPELFGGDGLFDGQAAGRDQLEIGAGGGGRACEDRRERECAQGGGVRTKMTGREAHGRSGAAAAGNGEHGGANGSPPA
jgi:hypothetical protein